MLRATIVSILLALIPGAAAAQLVLDAVAVFQGGGEALEDVGHDALMWYVTGVSANEELGARTYRYSDQPF